MFAKGNGFASTGIKIIAIDMYRQSKQRTFDYLVCIFIYTTTTLDLVINVRTLGVILDSTNCLKCPTMTDFHMNNVAHL